MRNLLLSAVLLTSMPLMANLAFNSYDVDSIILDNGLEVSVYDLQDGFESVEGVRADFDTITLDTRKAKRVRSIRLLGGDSGGGATIVIGMRAGGDMGGGGL